ncbi:MAG: hypothetical protein UHK60_01250, partial [Acutalibacteraceae bacterium]|nr:hypothetical protein [Acutalibacteraceae bacterium]
HPCLAWERSINERTNRILRRFILKGTSIDSYADDEIRMFSDEINSLPRKRLSYHTAEMFEKELDKIYASPYGDLDIVRYPCWFEINPA